MWRSKSKPRTNKKQNKKDTHTHTQQANNAAIDNWARHTESYQINQHLGKAIKLIRSATATITTTLLATIITITKKIETLAWWILIEMWIYCDWVCVTRWTFLLHYTCDIKHHPPMKCDEKVGVCSTTNAHNA